MAVAPGVCQDGDVTGAASYDVVMVTHHHADTLEASLASVQRLVPGPERVVVVDNASEDGSVSVAMQFDGRLPLKVLKLGENTGFTGGFNRGLGEGSAAWVLSLNPDCAPAPDFVGRLLKAVEAGRRQVGSATGRLVRANGADLAPRPVVDAAGMIVLPSGRHLDRGAGEPDDGRYMEPAWVFGGTGAATLYRREALEDVAYPGGEVMAESFFAYREDAELAWRLQWRGWECRYEPTASAVHARGLRPEAGRRGRRWINRHSVRNRFLLRWHCADGGWHRACFPWWLVRDLAVVGACFSVETSTLPALAEVWSLRSDAASRRRWVLGRASVSSRRMRRWFRRKGWVEAVESG